MGKSGWRLSLWPVFHDRCHGIISNGRIHTLAKGYCLVQGFVNVPGQPFRITLSLKTLQPNISGWARVSAKLRGAASVPIAGYCLDCAVSSGILAHPKFPCEIEKIIVRPRQSRDWKIPATAERQNYLLLLRQQPRFQTLSSLPASGWLASRVISSGPTSVITTSIAPRSLESCRGVPTFRGFRIRHPGAGHRENQIRIRVAVCVFRRNDNLDLVPGFMAGHGFQILG